MTIQEIENLKKKIEVAKENKIKYQVKIDEIMSKLKKEFNVNTIEEANDLVKEKEEKIFNLQAKSKKYESKIIELLKDFE